MHRSTIKNNSNCYNIFMVYCFFLMLFSFSACEKDVKINYPDKERKMTVNSLFQNDSLIKVNLSKSFSITENISSYPYINDAEIKIYEDNKFKENLKLISNGNYTSSFIPISGKSYKIEVNHNIYPSASATSSLPNNVTSVITDSSIDYNTGFCNCSIKFNDPANETNYYWISAVEIIEEYQTGDTLPTYYSYPLYLDSSDPNIGVNNNLDTTGLIFTDKFINGKEYTISFNCYIDWDVTKIKIIFSNISQDLYSYLYSYYMNQNSNNPNAVKIYNNINNGYGIFAGYNNSVFYINN